MGWACSVGFKVNKSRMKIACHGPNAGPYWHRKRGQVSFPAILLLVHLIAQKRDLTPFLLAGCVLLDLRAIGAIDPAGET